MDNNIALTAGYLDGLRGIDPRPGPDAEDYEEGWLHGAEDRASGVPDRFLEPPSGLCRGATVTIPKGVEVRTTSHGLRLAGRNYKVKIHDVYPMVPAYRYHGFVRPSPAKIVWPGTGGYWSEAAVADVRIELVPSTASPE